MSPKPFWTYMSSRRTEFSKQMLKIKDLETSTFLVGNSMTQVSGDSQGKTMKQARNNVILKLHNGFK